MECNSAIATKVKCFINSFKNHVSNNSMDSLSYDDLSSLLSEVIFVIQSIFEHNEELLNGNNSYINESILKELDQHLEMVIMSLNVLNEFVMSMTLNRPLDNRQCCDIPISISRIIHSTFSHCKNSNDTYQIYFEHLEKLKNLFTITQALHEQWLIFIEEKLIFQEGDSMLCQIVNSVADIGVVLLNLNTKSMLHTWRSYTRLIKKYGANVSGFEILKPLRILLSEILATVKHLVETNRGDVPILKVGNFLVRVCKTIMLTFWKDCIEITNKTDLFRLFTHLYKFADLLESDFSVENAQLLRAHIYGDLVDVVCMLVSDSAPLNIQHVQEQADFAGFINLSKMHIMQTKLFIHNYLHLLLKYLADFNVDVRMEAKGHFYKDANYRPLVVKLVVTILSLPGQDYLKIEEQLVANLFDGNRYQAGFAFDLYVLLMKNVQPTLRFDTLAALIDRCKRNSPHVYRGQPILQAFLRRCYALLPSDLQDKLLVRYLSDADINVWMLCGIRPPHHSREYLLDVIAKNILTKCEAHDRTASDLPYMIDAMSVLANLLTSGQQLEPKASSSSMAPKDLPAELQSKLSELVTKLWHFDESLAATNDTYVYFLKHALLPLLMAFIARGYMNNAQLLQILTRNVNNDSRLQPLAKICTSKILLTLCQTSPDEYNAILHSLVAGFITQDLDLENQDPVVSSYTRQAQRALQANQDWAKILVLHGDNVENVEPPNKKPKLLPKCLPKPQGLKPQNAGQINEKMGDPVEEEIADILENIKDEVKQLNKIVTRARLSKLSGKASSDLFVILTKLNQLV